MNVVMASVSGSPGVSVWSVLVAGLWPSDNPLERVVVEADLAGGVMGVRYQLRSKTDTMIAAAPRWDRNADSVDLRQFADRVGEGAWLVPGPQLPENVERLWRTSEAAASVAAMAARDQRVWFFDVGRGRPDGVLESLFKSATVVVLFVRGSAEELVKVPGRLAALKDSSSRVMVAVTGSTDHAQGDVSEFLGVRDIHFLGDDGHLVDDSRQAWSARRSRRRSVWAAGSALAGAIAEVVEFAPRDLLDSNAELE